MPSMRRRGIRRAGILRVLSHDGSPRARARASTAPIGRHVETASIEMAVKSAAGHRVESASRQIRDRPNPRQHNWNFLRSLADKPNGAGACIGMVIVITGQVIYLPTANNECKQLFL